MTSAPTDPVTEPKLSGIRFKEVGTTSATVVVAVDGASHAGVPVYVRYKRGGGEWGHATGQTDPGTGTAEVAIDGLTVGKSYKVEASLNANYRPWLYANFRTALTEASASGPPAIVAEPTITPGNRELKVSWKPPDAASGGPAERYRIEWKRDDQEYGGGREAETSELKYTIKYLGNGVRYTVRVMARNDSGTGPSWEGSASPTSGSGTVLATPVFKEPKALHHNMVELAWEDIEGADLYEVRYWRGGGFVKLPALGIDVAFNGPVAVVSGLPGNRISWFEVRAVGCAGDSEWSEQVEVWPTKESDWEDVPVPTVESVEATRSEGCPVRLDTPVFEEPEALDHLKVKLAWEDIAGADTYEVRYWSDGGFVKLPALGIDVAFNGSSAVVSGLPEGRFWVFEVRALSEDGESEWSENLQVWPTQASDWETEGENSPATGAPTVGGTAQVGETLTADTAGIADADGLTSATFSYQWIANDGTTDTDISGATGQTYALDADDEGKTVKVRVSFTDDEGHAETLTSAATAEVAARPNSPATGAPAISGTAQVGETLTANTSGIADADGLTSATFSYQWIANDGTTETEIAGATGSSYALSGSDLGQTVKVQVSFTDDAGHQESVTSQPIGPVDHGVSEQQTNSPATGQPTISGTAQVDETLTADTSGIADEDGLTDTSFSYQWIRNDGDDADIQGATASTYTLDADDEGKTVKVRVSFTDDEGHGETLTSAATAQVAARPNSPATGAPTIGGTAQVGETLTVSTSGIADADGLDNLKFNHQWLADDADIKDATGQTYTLIGADKGKSIKVLVSFVRSPTTLATRRPSPAKPPPRLRPGPTLRPRAVPPSAGRPRWARRSRRTRRASPTRTG